MTVFGSRSCEFKPQVVQNEHCCQLSCLPILLFVAQNCLNLPKIARTWRIAVQQLSYYYYIQWKGLGWMFISRIQFYFFEWKTLFKKENCIFCPPQNKSFKSKYRITSLSLKHSAWIEILTRLWTYFYKLKISLWTFRRLVPCIYLKDKASDIYLNQVNGRSIDLIQVNVTCHKSD